MAKRMRMRDGAGRQHRADPAPQTQARRPRRPAFSRRCRIERGAEQACDNPRESAADSRKQAKRPAQGARTAKRQGVTAISRLPNPRDARRNAHPAPNRRAPGIGRTCTTHDTRRRPEAGHPPTAGATRQMTPDFHFPKNGNRDFTLYLLGHARFHARKIGEPPTISQFVNHKT